MQSPVRTLKKVFYAPHYHELGREPLIFLAGPIQGAYDWQTTAIQMLRFYEVNKAHIASPRRPIKHSGDFTDAMFDEQADWELHYLHYAVLYGVALFWCAKEHEHFCERAYAQTTRFEMGMTMKEHILQKASMVVGIEPGFSGERYIRHALGRKAPRVKIFSTLEETCRGALDLIC